jgi:RNA polymerase sigma factor (TIGR02999 family)
MIRGLVGMRGRGKLPAGIGSATWPGFNAFAAEVGVSLSPQPAKTMSDQHDVTAKLSELSAGRREAWDELMPIVYGELKRMAHRHLRGERPGHTLNTTAIVHEAYLKLVNIDQLQWRDRAHFFAMASRAMRRILIDHARTRSREKRGGGWTKVTLDDAFMVAEERAEDMIALDEALTRLESVNERQCRVVEYRFFGGMSIQETAEAIGISAASVKRDWMVTRAWLNQELGLLDSE